MQRRLLCILAHPDDETLAMGGVLARYAAEGVETHLLTATSGEQGWQGLPAERPTAEELARIREAELHEAAAILGIASLTLLRYPDGGLAAADHEQATARITQLIRQVRPQVVVTFGPDGLTGHPDHIAISQLTSAALLCAADPAYRTLEAEPAHRVSKLYYLAPLGSRLNRYANIFGDPVMTVDGVRRSTGGWPEWSISAGITTAPYVYDVWRAICAHQSQFPLLDSAAELPLETQATLGGLTTFYRAYSLSSAQHQHEIDLFAGLT